MADVVLGLSLPPDVYLALQAAGLDRDKLSAQVARELAVQLYSDGRLSLGKAARLAGLRLPEFWRVLVDRGLPVFSYDVDDYENDIETIEQWSRANAQP